MKKKIALLLVFSLLWVLCSPAMAAETSFEAFDLKYSYHGMAGKNFRFIVEKTDIPFTVTETNMNGLKVEGKLKDLDNNKELDFSSQISKVEIKDTTVVLVIPETSIVKASAYSDDTAKTPKHQFVLKVYPQTASENVTNPSSAPGEPPKELEYQEMKFKDSYAYYFLTTENFKDQLGGWTVATDSPLTNLYISSNNGAVAETKLVVPKDGTYYIWGRSRDYASNSPGSRNAKVSVDGEDMKNLLGKHGMEGFAWTLTGNAMLTAGEHQLAVTALTGFARVDMILVTNDPSFKPVNAEGTLLEISQNRPYRPDEVVVSNQPDAPDPDRPDVEIAVKYNDEYMTFDVDPVLVNDRTMVPLRAIFEKLGCTVSWNDDTQTAVGIRNGRRVAVTIGTNDASVAGEAVSVDQPPVLIDDRTMVPLRFISEAYGAAVDWNNDTQTVSIYADEVPFCVYLNKFSFSEVGTWKVTGEGLEGITSHDPEDGGGEATDTEPAKTAFQIPAAGKYRVWVKSKDFATNQQGTRYFHIAVDGTRNDTKFGAHGQDGYHWTDAGVYDFTEGSHLLELMDTSGFYARFSGFFVCDDLDYVPSDSDEELSQVAVADNPLADLQDVSYPGYAKGDMTDEKTGEIQNDAVKIVFYQGQSTNGPLVQNEIYIKDETGEWIQVKGRTEELGFLMMRADTASYAGDSDQSSMVGIRVTANGNEYGMSVGNFYQFGLGEWLIPSDFEILSDRAIKLTFPANEKVDFTATYAFDDLADDVKVTVNAAFHTQGAYSFALFSGDGVNYENFETVTAPLLYTKHAIPKGPTVYSEPYLFTPMNTLYFNADNNVKTPGKQLTSGVVVDPAYVKQDFAYPDTARFGTMFYTTGGKVRPQLVAPMMGNDCANFDVGETYEFAYRIVNRFQYWYDTYKHVAVDLYNCTDLRTNWFSSINETIYNTTDLIMDDYYGGWDKEAMGYYNMEGQDLISQSNVMSVAQRYMETEDEALLEERVVPTIAYLLTRRGPHSNITGNTEGGTLSYAGKAPSSLSSPITMYNSAVYGGLYEMSQGRMPYLLDYAVNQANSNGITGKGALYKYTQDEQYKQEIIQAADDYLATYPNSKDKREINLVNGFVYGDYTAMVSNLVSAYELTGDKKYLDAAEEAGRLLTAAVWTTGYQNDYATTDYTVDPVSTTERPMNCERYNFFWHGATKWRPGNQDGEGKSPQDLALDGVTIPQETVPGWLPAKAGQGTEHPRTPGHGNVITMNNWAGTMVRLSVYTGDDWFETMARNTVVGRYASYPGYYVDRYLTHINHADYMQTGPDFSSVYWHHIPIYLSMVEDFLINEAWAKSKQNIAFPYVYQGGYAYFNSYQFGQAPGKFYDEDDMWLWLDRGIIETDNVNIDYVAGRKDGVLGLGLMNEDSTERTTVIKLGEKVEGGSSYTNTATVYTADGQKSTVEVVNGTFSVTIPSKGIMTVILKDVGVQSPSYAKEYSYSNEIGQTVSSHVNGKGYVIQMNDDAYYAYVYVTDMPDNTQSVKLTYTVNGKTQTLVDDQFAYEFIVKVDDPSQAFAYQLEATGTDGKTKDLGGGTLKTLSNSELKGIGVVVGESQMPDSTTTVKNDLKFDPFQVTYTGQGTGSGYLRFVIPAGQFPFPLTADCLAGIKATIVATEVATGTKETYEVVVAGNEMRGDGGITLLIPPKGKLVVADYDNDKAKTHTFEITLSPAQ